MKSTNFKAIGLAVTLGVVLSACGTTEGGNRMLGTTMTDKSFGSAVREARMRQTIDMNAGSKHADNTGGDAGTAALAVKRYQDSFKNPQPTLKVLGIGSNDKQ